LPDELTSVARQEADEISIQTCTVAYLPIVGYLLMAPASVEIPASSSMLVQLVSRKNILILLKLNLFLDTTLGLENRILRGIP